MKMKILTLGMVFVLAVLMSESASALGTGFSLHGVYGPVMYYDTLGGGYFAPVVPGAPQVDSTVRVGPRGTPTASYFAVGLREGIVTHAPMNYAQRAHISSQYYPRATFYGPHGSRTIRVGGYFGSGAARISGTAGGFQFA